MKPMYLVAATFAIVIAFRLFNPPLWLQLIGSILAFGMGATALVLYLRDRRD